MSGRVMLLLNNVAVVCESATRPVKCDSKLCSEKPSAGYGFIVIPIAFCFDAAENRKKRIGKEGWNGLFRNSGRTA